MRDVLTRPGTVVERGTFPEDGHVSVIMPIAATRVEVGMIGFEGVVGAAEAVLDGRCAVYEHVVQNAGFAHVIAVTNLRDAMCASPALTATLQRLVQAELDQARHTAFAPSASRPRSRWVLMCHGVKDADLTLTHAAPVHAAAMADVLAEKAEGRARGPVRSRGTRPCSGMQVDLDRGAVID
ncbi:hypothetical protein MKK58_07465 [Methylobacterium sp. J-078]|uniref:hypothetical protein n=1 Tax=Methylobacterium sp. J-078 TaxID=2836657 RepID=UPI001FBBEAD5|nr:hypothetical protein [Methylobacterium sp. J-078]MCJ2044373.1 hypothetical protein [Methylobacterium sp. J-078]